MRLSRFLVTLHSFHLCVIAGDSSDELHIKGTELWQQNSNSASDEHSLALSNEYGKIQTSEATVQSSFKSGTTPLSHLAVDSMLSQSTPSVNTFEAPSLTSIRTEETYPSSALPTGEHAQMSSSPASTLAITTATTPNVPLEGALTDHIVVPILHEDNGDTSSKVPMTSVTPTVAYSSNESPDPYLAAIAYETSQAGDIPTQTRGALAQSSNSRVADNKVSSQSATVQSLQTADPTSTSEFEAHGFLSLLNGIFRPPFDSETTEQASVKRISTFLNEVFPSFLSLPVVTATSTSESILEPRSGSANEVARTASDSVLRPIETPAPTEIQIVSANKEPVQDIAEHTTGLGIIRPGTETISDQESRPSALGTTASATLDASIPQAVSSLSSASENTVSNVNEIIDPSRGEVLDSSSSAAMPSSSGISSAAMISASDSIASLNTPPLHDELSVQQNTTTIDRAPSAEATESVQSSTEPTQSPVQAQANALPMATERSSAGILSTMEGTGSNLTPSQPSPFNKVATAINSATTEELSQSQTWPTQSSQSLDASHSHDDSLLSSNNYFADASTPYPPIAQSTTPPATNSDGSSHLSDILVDGQLSTSTQLQHSQQTAIAAVSSNQVFLSGGALSSGISASLVTGLSGTEDSLSESTSSTSMPIESIALSTQGSSQAQEISATGVSDVLESATITASMSLPSMSLPSEPSISSISSDIHATETDTTMSLPPIILTAQSEPTGQDPTVLVPSATASATASAWPNLATVSLPGAIAPATGMMLPSAAQIIVQIGFTAPLNYPFVVSNALTTAQIFSYLPKALAIALSVPPETIISNSLRPFPRSNYTATVAYVVIPKTQQTLLGQLITTRNSALYAQSDAALQSLVNLIDSSIPLLPTSNGATATRVVTTAATKVPSNGNLANSGSLAELTPASSTVTSTQKIAGIGGGAAVAASAYACLMFFIVRRYRARSLQAERPMSIASRKSPKSFRAGRAHLPISSPTNVENSLGI